MWWPHPQLKCTTNNICADWASHVYCDKYSNFEASRYNQVSSVEQHHWSLKAIMVLMAFILSHLHLPQAAVQLKGKIKLKHKGQETAGAWTTLMRLNTICYSVQVKDKRRSPPSNRSPSTPQRNPHHSGSADEQETPERVVRHSYAHWHTHTYTSNTHKQWHTQGNTCINTHIHPLQGCFSVLIKV